MKVTLGGPMSYAEAKEIALLRQKLRACWDSGDTAGAREALQRLRTVAGEDGELAAEARRWTVKLAA
jgi:hypothetical protein